MQARGRDSVTGGAEINFGETRKVYLLEFISVEQTKKVKTQKKGLQLKNFHKLLFSSQNFATFYESYSKDQKKGLRPQIFMKSGVSPQKLRKNSSCSQIVRR